MVAPGPDVARGLRTDPGSHAETSGCRPTEHAAASPAIESRHA
jgi:hypothetical protein